MKVSNLVVMVLVYWFFVLEMYLNDWDYLLYFGVIEVGEGEDGCMKLVIGIGVLF